MSDLIRKECNCKLEEEAIDQDHLLCDHSQLNKTVFRAEIVTYQLTSDDLLIILQNMVTGGRLMLNESTVIELDTNCPVKISSLSDPLCGALMTTSDNVEVQQTKSSPLAIIIGSIVAVIIIIILLVFLTLLVLYRRSRRRYIYTIQAGYHEIFTVGSFHGFCRFLC